MAKIDVSKLSAAELDELIADAALQRSKVQPEVSGQPPDTGSAIKDPAWRTFMEGENTALLLRHPGLGWLAFIFPPHERAHILALFLQQALAKPQPQAVAADVPTTGSGGGTIH